jgi:hypothetical protein
MGKLDNLRNCDKLSPMKELEKTEGRKQRDHTKTGKLARRRETRRLQAIERQVRRIQSLETALPKAKKQSEAQAKLTHAQLTLQKIRGGVDHNILLSQFKPQTPETAVKPIK